MRHAAQAMLGVLFFGAEAFADPLVVIDPGHGGSNTGALGQAGLYEKEFTLGLSRALSRRLSAMGIDNVLTRTRDVYVTIRGRSRLANRLQPTCFISLHTNASLQRNRSGTEVYVLSSEWAKVERAHDQVEEAKNDRVQLVLAELAGVERQRRARELGGLVESELVAVRRQKTRGDKTAIDRGVREGNYDVLAGLRVPGVLVEVGYLDHPLEGRELLEEAPQLADAIARAVARFVDGQPRTLPVASTIDRAPSTDKVAACDPTAGAQMSCVPSPSHRTTSKTRRALRSSGPARRG